ncbi:cellulase family glycosylhydrolase [Lentzea flaviverrucosa]|uniref:cellulase n=1 Tax=Lentzea flaviverrucosa TaxID=200379 RepID=A0A1H9WA79_9PSEU|nr:cellulase family glycosylhydrolase [Lentzea flaviverrucosa]RDI22255.1 endoglucanase [Lentzea flaviverrucosa]SES30810.1 endoglucanase [Lentzea flaviverrucosa]
MARPLLLVVPAALALAVVPAVAIAAPVQYQAESATISNGLVESNHAGFTGSGFVNYDNEVGSSVEFTVDAGTAGPATLTFRFANGQTANRPMDISVNGSVVASQLSFPSTGAWTSWTTKSTTVTLNAGSNKIRTVATTVNGGPNLDRIDVDAQSGTPDTAAPSVPGSLRSTGTTASSVSLAWNASTDNVGVTGYVLSNGQTASGTTHTVSGLTPDTAYTFTVQARDAAGNLSGASNSISVRTQPGTPGGTRPHDINGLLRVCGVQLCNQYGNPIQLRGMSTHGIQWYHQCSKSQWWDALVNDWNADFIRVAMYIQEDGYETDPRKFTDMMHGYIEEATRRGIYVLVDWHQLSPGDPNYNLSRAKTFFTEIANRHKDKTNIIYDIANEPNGTSWSRVKSYAEQMIPVIRNIDPDSLIVSGTNGWSTFGHSDGDSPSEVLNNRVNATNFMYSFHFYAQAHKDAYLSVLDQVSSQVPVFVTEFGTQAASGGGSNDFTMSQKYIDLMARKKISWANWNFSDDGLTGAVFKTGTCSGTTFAGTGVLKPAGVWVRERIRTPDSFLNE